MNIVTLIRRLAMCGHPDARQVQRTPTLRECLDCGAFRTPTTPGWFLPALVEDLVKLFGPESPPVLMVLATSSGQCAACMGAAQSSAQRDFVFLIGVAEGMMRGKAPPLCRTHAAELELVIGTIREHFREEPKPS